MLKNSDIRLIEKGIEISDSGMLEQDKIWSRYSSDKVDIGEELAKVIRVLDKAVPLGIKMRALSIGSSDEPQFRILETAFRGGLYLLDIDHQAFQVVKERIGRQNTKHVTCLKIDYNKVFKSRHETLNFLKNRLREKKVNLITLHHSMYYCQQCDWSLIFENLYQLILTNTSAMHAVLMASESKSEYTTTWLYNHFAGKFFGSKNTQDLNLLRKELKSSFLFRKAQVFLNRHRVRFFVEDFTKFMSVVWMILLYPDVHKYSFQQREEIAEFVYRKLWLNKVPLIQLQDHLVVYKGINFPGLI